MTTGIVFALVFAVHIWRAIVEDFRPLTEPVFILLTLLALGLAAWSARLLRR
jgi:hypothetical protein